MLPRTSISCAGNSWQLTAMQPVAAPPTGSSCPMQTPQQPLRPHGRLVHPVLRAGAHPAAPPPPDRRARCRWPRAWSCGLPCPAAARRPLPGTCAPAVLWAAALGPLAKGAGWLQLRAVRVPPSGMRCQNGTCLHLVSQHAGMQACRVTCAWSGRTMGRLSGSPWAREGGDQGQDDANAVLCGQQKPQLAKPRMLPAACSSCSCMDGADRLAGHKPVAQQMCCAAVHTAAPIGSMHVVASGQARWTSTSDLA